MNGGKEAFADILHCFARHYLAHPDALRISINFARCQAFMVALSS